MAAPQAWAYVDESDVLFGLTATERGLSNEAVPSIEAPFAVVIDDTGVTCFARHAEDATQIASLTKIMTAIVAVEVLDSQTSIEVTPTASAVGESSAGLIAGDVMAFSDALKALLTASGNDAATALAEAAGAQLLAAQGTSGDAYACQAAFVTAMNAKAAELGMENTLFTNAHGLDFDQWAQGQYSCAQDTATMLRYAMQLQPIRDNIGFSSVDITVERSGAPTVLTLTNTDTMLRTYEGTCAAKTGYTLAAGACLATAVNRNDGHEYYTVVLGAPTKEQRFTDSQTLYDWVYANRDALAQAASPAVEEPAKPQTETYQLVCTERFCNAALDNVEGTWPVVAKIALDDWPGRVLEATVAEPDASVEVPADAGPIQQQATFQKVAGDVHAGDVVGHLTFSQDGSVLWEGDLLALQDVAPPMWWERIGIWFQQLVGAVKPVESELVALGPVKVS